VRVEDIVDVEVLVGLHGHVGVGSPVAVYDELKDGVSECRTTGCSASRCESLNVDSTTRFAGESKASASIELRASLGISELCMLVLQYKITDDIATDVLVIPLACMRCAAA
jgi:hypothetical protein